MKTKLPPYASLISNFKHDEVIICTGRDAWRIAKRETWQCRVAKLVLPFGADPGHFRWPVAGRWCQVWSCGDPEAHDRLLALSTCLILSGALKVLLIDIKRPIEVIKPGRKAAV